MQMKTVALAHHLQCLHDERHSRHLKRYRNDLGLMFCLEGKSLIIEAFFMQVWLNPTNGVCVECNPVSTKSQFLAFVSHCKWTDEPNSDLRALTLTLI